MYRINFLAIFCFLLCGANAQTYLLNPDSCSLSWTGYAAFQSYALTGTLDTKMGAIVIDGQVLDSATVVVDMLRLDADNDQLAQHLRSADFFDVQKFPTADFILTAGAEDQQSYQGKLTIKEVVHDYRFPLDIKVWAESIVVEGRLEIDRTDFGIVYNSPSVFKKLKDQAIADTFVLEIALIFERVD